MAELVSVRFRSEGKQYYFDPQGQEYRAGDDLIVETTNGIEYAFCVRGNFQLAESELAAPLRPVIRLATPEDRQIVARNREKESYAFKVCQEKILEHKLEMKLVGVECSFEGTKILFFFTSEGRVDFRGLVKSLASVFHTRIELRQIGIRDESKMLGGLGICGRPFCCTSFLREFQPVSIKMAKTQNLSLNPTKISGTCGRLMCCLKYEQEAYEDLMKDAPRVDSFVETPDGAGTIISVNTLREKVRIRLDSEPDTLKTYHNSELRVIRSGKGSRPENYVEPPKEELAKLRQVSDTTEDQYHQEQEILTAVLDDFMESQSVHAEIHRRGDRSRHAEKAEKAVEAALTREKENHEAKPNRTRQHHSRPNNKRTQETPEISRDREKADSSNARRRAPRPNSSQPAEGENNKPPMKSKKTGKDKKGRPYWHKRGPRRKPPQLP